VLDQVIGKAKTQPGSEEPASEEHEYATPTVLNDQVEPILHTSKRNKLYFYVLLQSKCHWHLSVFGTGEPKNWTVSGE
jgi:hypothetical protein